MRAGELTTMFAQTKRFKGWRFLRGGGRLLPAENMGIFCVSRIFVGDTGDDSTNITCHLAIPRPLRSSLWLLSDESESDIKKENEYKNLLK